MKTISRVLVAMVAAIAALFVSTGTSHAGLDNELSLVDGQDRTLTVQQWDTFLNGVGGACGAGPDRVGLGCRCRDDCGGRPAGGVAADGDQVA